MKINIKYIHIKYFFSLKLNLKKIVNPFVFAITDNIGKRNHRPHSLNKLKKRF